MNDTTIDNENINDENLINDEEQEDSFYDKFIPNLKQVLIYREIEVPDDIILKMEIDKAIGEINRCRRFTPTEEHRYDVKYEDMIIPMVMSALAKVGIEGENSHSENGVQRIYVSDGEYPTALTSRIVPLIK